MKDGIFYNRGILDGHYYGTLLPSAASSTATTITSATNTQKPSPFKRSATLIVCETKFLMHLSILKSRNIEWNVIILGSNLTYIANINSISVLRLKAMIFLNYNCNIPHKLYRTHLQVEGSLRSTRPFLPGIFIKHIIWWSYFFLIRIYKSLKYSFSWFLLFFVSIMLQLADFNQFFVH